MDLVIDTSSPSTGLALLGGGSVVAQREAGRLGVEELPDAVASLVGDVRALGRVVIVTGPGSFTGLRAGASYGIGLAQGLRIPLLGLGTFDLARALATVPARPVVEAGRGRVYIETPDGGVVVAELAAVPRDLPLAGRLSEALLAAARDADLPLLPPAACRDFGAAALSALDRAISLPYGRVKLLYVTSVGQVRN